MKYSLKTKATALFLILVIIGLILFYYCHDLPSLTKLEKQQSQRVIHINYDNGNTTLINKRGNEIASILGLEKLGNLSISGPGFLSGDFTINLG